MNELQIFKNAELGSVRAVAIGGEVYFVGKDVAEILGYTNPSEALIEHVDAEDKLNSKTLSSFDFDLGQRGGWLINESGLYSLILSSKLPSARKFKRWVTSEVLPSIRRHGMYATDDLIANPDLAIAAFTALKQERERTRQLSETIAVQNQQIAEMQPKVSYYDIVLQCRDVLPIRVIAKDYGWSANKMNKYLHEKGIQFKQGNKVWLLYQKYANKGYTSTKTHVFESMNGENHTSVHTYWTQAGRLFIYSLMKADGYLPLIEQEV